MSPSILIVGATGNTGRNVVRTLPRLLPATIGEYRILALTRDLNSSVSKELAKLNHVELIEKNWTEIDADWLKANEVTRAFVAGHIWLSQFTEELGLLVAMLHAGVKYVVRISTMKEFIGPASKVYYGRAHWGIEQALSQPDFEPLQWTSLQPNVFVATYLGAAVQWVQDFKNTGKQAPFKTLLGADDPVAVIDPDDVGHIAATLLAAKDPSSHNKSNYIIRGPEDITGKEIIDLIERHASVKVQDIRYHDTSSFPDAILPTLLAACEPVWAGKCTTSGTPTSQEILALAPPRTRIAESSQKMLG